MASGGLIRPQENTRRERVAITRRTESTAGGLEGARIAAAKTPIASYIARVEVKGVLHALVHPEAPVGVAPLLLGIVLLNARGALMLRAFDASGVTAGSDVCLRVSSSAPARA